MIGTYLFAGLATGVVIEFLILYFVLKNYQDTITIRAEVKERVLQLFLYAEKLELTGPEKLNYVACKIDDHVPGKVLDIILDGRNLTDFLQEHYDEIFSRIKD